MNNSRFSVNYCDSTFSFVALALASDGKRFENREDGISVDIKLPIKSVLSRELQVKYRDFLMQLFFS